MRLPQLTNNLRIRQNIENTTTQIHRKFIFNKVDGFFIIIIIIFVFLVMAIPYRRGLWRFLQIPPEILQDQNDWRVIDNKYSKYSPTATTRTPPSLKNIILRSSGEFEDIQNISPLRFWTEVMTSNNTLLLSEDKTFLVCLCGHLIRDRFANTSLPLYNTPPYFKRSLLIYIAIISSFCCTSFLFKMPTYMFETNLGLPRY